MTKLVKSLLVVVACLVLTSCMVPATSGEIMEKNHYEEGVFLCGKNLYCHRDESWEFHIVDGLTWNDIEVSEEVFNSYEVGDFYPGSR